MDLNEKLARQAGFRLEEMDFDRGIKGLGWVDPNGERVTRGATTIPDFTSSLDACFKWLVPKCRSVMLYEQGAPEVHNVVAEAYLGMRSGHFSGDTTPALALSKAIEQLIDKESK